MPRVLAFGDLHLGQGADIGRSPGDRLKDQADVLDRIADLAIERECALVLVAGDVFEGPSIPPEQLDVFASFVDRCRHARIPVLAITGNSRHDAAMRATNGLAIFSHIPGVTVSSFPDVYRLGGCAVATLPWVSPARLVASRGGGDRDELHGIVAQLLTDIAQRGKEDCERVAPDAPHILLGHWSLSGASLPTGLPVDALREPIIPAAELAALGYDALVFGHIHKSQDLRDGRFSERQTQAPFFYVGSPLALNFGEGGFEHGVYLIETEKAGHGVYWHKIDSRPLVTVDVDFTDGDDFSMILEDYMFPDGVAEGGIVRARYRCDADTARKLDLNEIRRHLVDAGAASVKFVPDIIRADRARVDGLDDSMSELDALDEWSRVNGVDDLLAGLMREKTRDYLAVVS